tara:strand:+ start:658 stop:1044 length:387 start_codon:yes stop_codon:yes gene_type:complete
MNYKKLLGKEIFLLPSGNAVERGKGGAINQIASAKVIKVARVFVTVEIKEGDFKYERKLRVNTHNPEMLIIDNFNGGYKAFESHERVEEYKLAVKTKSQLIDNLHTLSDSDLCKIAKALGWDNDALQS